MPGGETKHRGECFDRCDLVERQLKHPVPRQRVLDVWPSQFCGDNEQVTRSTRRTVFDDDGNVASGEIPADGSNGTLHGLASLFILICEFVAVVDFVCSLLFVVVFVAVVVGFLF